MKVVKVVIGSTERGIVFRNKQFVRILEPGTYRFVNFVNFYTVDIVDIARSPELKGASAQLLSKQSSTLTDKYFMKVVMESREVGIVYLDKQAFDVLSPGEERLFWKGLSASRVEKFNISESYEIDKETLRDLSVIMNEQKIINVKIPEKSVGLLFESGVLVRELQPGRYAFWRAQRDLAISVLDTRITALEVSGQEMLTKDKVSLRINLAVSYRLVDAMLAVRALADISGEIYRSAQLALRQTVGEKTLDELLESKQVVNGILRESLLAELAKFGIELSNIGVKDIILPGDMRTLLNQVVEAEKAAQAQNIRRREETAATRSLLNTARMMENNPVLLRLKELESVERISEKVEKLTVYDGLKGVMNGLVKLAED